jgi:hypothetical protein
MTISGGHARILRLLRNASDSSTCARFEVDAQAEVSPQDSSPLVAFKDTSSATSEVKTAAQANQIVPKPKTESRRPTR